MAAVVVNGYRFVFPYLDTIKNCVKGPWVGKTIGDVLGGIVLPLFPKSSLQEAFEGGRVLVNGSPVQHHHLLSLNQSFEFLLHRHESKVYVGEGERTLELLCVNKHHIVINKPSSVPVHPVGRYKKNTVVGILRDEYPELFQDGKDVKFFHRLDRLVSGVLVLPRTSAIAAELCKQIREGHISKVYLARVKGKFPHGRTEVRQPIAKVQGFPTVYGICPLKGKDAVTIFERDSVLPDESESIVRCIPITGRSHQIRVHLQWLGHPITNDYKYGGHVDQSIDTSETELRIPEHSKCQWCFLCRIGSLPAPPSLSWEECHPTSIWLHALCYTNTCPSSPWSYQAPLPPWATAPFVTSSLTS